MLVADDWAVWRDVRLRALTDAPEAFGSTLADWQGGNDIEQRWRERFDNVAVTAVALVGGDVVGTVGAMHHLEIEADANSPGAGSVELISMWVDPGVRGTGVGEALIDAVLDWARSEVSADIRVTLAVRRANLHARLLYERMGFVLVGPNPDDGAEQLMVRAPNITG